MDKVYLKNNLNYVYLKCKTIFKFNCKSINDPMTSTVLYNKNTVCG